jgi:N-acetylmuramoyl-L-alanine amidase
MDIYQISKDSNDFGAEIHIAIHSNAGGGEGTEVFAYAPGTNSERLAKALYNQIAPLSPGTDRGVKYNPRLVEVGDLVKATACLIELDFHDSANGAAWLVNSANAIAIRLFKGICDFYGYEYARLIPIVTTPIAEDEDIHLSVRVRQSRSDGLREQIIAMGYACEILKLA